MFGMCSSGGSTPASPLQGSAGKRPGTLLAAKLSTVAVHDPPVYHAVITLHLSVVQACLSASPVR